MFKPCTGSGHFLPATLLPPGWCRHVPWSEWLKECPHWSSCLWVWLFQWWPSDHPITTPGLETLQHPCPPVSLIREQRWSPYNVLWGPTWPGRHVTPQPLPIANSVPGPLTSLLALWSDERPPWALAQAVPPSGKFFPQIFTQTTTSPPSHLCLNVVFSVKPTHI